MCAQEVGLTKIPVNEVAEPSLVQNIVTMFQIHKLRKDWELRRGLKDFSQFLQPRENLGPARILPVAKQSALRAIFGADRGR